MIIKSARLRNTAISIIKEFNKKKINYGLGRNYNHFPNFGHDIDFYSTEDAQKLKKVLIVVAKKNGWDFLTHDIHFNGFLSKVSSIDTFHFYKFETGEYEVLHLDFFRSFIIFGLPFIKSSNIKMKKHKKKFYFIDINTENTFKLLQLCANISDKNFFHNEYVIKKRKIYKKKINSFYKKNKKTIVDNKLYFANAAIKSLQLNKLQNFKFYINASRFLYFIKYFFLNPFGFFFYLFSRLITLTNLFILNPPGLIINFYLEDKRQDKKVYKAFNLLKNKNFIHRWCIKKKILLSFSERKLLERGGSVVLFSSQPTSDTHIIKKTDNLNRILKIIIQSLIKKNKIIYKK